MSLSRQLLYLLATILGIVLLPYTGAWLHFEGHFPQGYFNFPQLVAPPVAGFNVWIFTAIALAFAGTAVFYLFPGWFGFKKVATPASPRKKVALPAWFWVGLVLWLVPLVTHWGKFARPELVLYWALVFLFWGFTLMLDGLVYARSGGHSLVSNNPRQLLAIGFASMGGWMVFEYLNFFVNDNWIYPYAATLRSKEGFTLYAVIGSSGLMPMCFEWYYLLNTFTRFRNRYVAGPKITLPRPLLWLVYLVCMTGLFATSFFPNLLFFLLWISPLATLAVTLTLLGIWTPFDEIKKGNWAPVMLMGLAVFIQGFVWEGCNYFSATHGAAGSVITTFNSGYWQYNVPFVSRFYVFEMPVLGYLGYVPFGVYCWIWWIVFSFLMNTPSKLDHAIPETVPERQSTDSVKYERLVPQEEVLVED